MIGTSSLAVRIVLIILHLKDPRKIDFKRHTSPPASKWYLIRIIIYVVLLLVAGIIIYSVYQKRDGLQEVQDVVEIEGVSVEVEE